MREVRPVEPAEVSRRKAISLQRPDRRTLVREILKPDGDLSAHLVRAETSWRNQAVEAVEVPEEARPIDVGLAVPK